MLVIQQSGGREAETARHRSRRQVCRDDLDDLEADEHARLGVQRLYCLAEGSGAEEVHDLQQHMQLGRTKMQCL